MISKYVTSLFSVKNGFLALSVSIEILWLEWRVIFKQENGSFLLFTLMCSLIWLSFQSWTKMEMPFLKNGFKVILTKTSFWFIHSKNQAFVNVCMKSSFKWRRWAWQGTVSKSSKQDFAGRISISEINVIFWRLNNQIFSNHLLFPSQKRLVVIKESFGGDFSIF